MFSTALALRRTPLHLVKRTLPSLSSPVLRRGFAFPSPQHPWKVSNEIPDKMDVEGKKLYDKAFKDFFHYMHIDHIDWFAAEVRDCWRDVLQDIERRDGRYSRRSENLKEIVSIIFRFYSSVQRNRNKVIPLNLRPQPIMPGDFLCDGPRTGNIFFSPPANPGGGAKKVFNKQKELTMKDDVARGVLENSGNDGKSKATDNCQGSSAVFQELHDDVTYPVENDYETEELEFKSLYGHRMYRSDDEIRNINDDTHVIFLIKIEHDRGIEDVYAAQPILDRTNGEVKIAPVFIEGTHRGTWIGNDVTVSVERVGKEAVLSAWEKSGSPEIFKKEQHDMTFFRMLPLIFE